MVKMAARFVFTMIFVAIFGGISAQQAPALGKVNRYQHEIQECVRVINSWQLQADTQKSVVALVIVFGALITIFQGWNKGWCKPATIVLGALTTILTGINAQLFAADYRVLEQSAIDGGDLVEQLNAIVDRLNQPQADIVALETQWIRTKTQFSGLQKTVLQHTSKTPAVLMQVQSVQAQSALPPWITQPPSDENNLYFPGTAEDPSIATARQRSLDNAVEVGTSRLAAGDAIKAATLRGIIASSSVIDKSSFEFDKSKKVYRYYTLVRISRDIESITAATPTLKNPLKIKAQDPIAMTFAKDAGILILDRTGLVSVLKGDVLESFARIPASYTPQDITATNIAGNDRIIVSASSPATISGSPSTVALYFSFTSRGQPPSITTALHAAKGVSLDGQRSTLYVDDNKDQIYSFRLASGRLSHEEPWVDLTAQTADFRGPKLGPLGILPWSSQVIAASGEYLFGIDIDSRKRVRMLVDTGFSIASIAVDETKRVVYPVGDHKLVRIVLGPKPTVEIMRSDFKELTGVAVDSNHGVWVCDRLDHSLQGPIE